MNDSPAKVTHIKRSDTEPSLRHSNTHHLCSKTVIEKLRADISYIENKLKLIDQKKLPNTLMRNNYLQMLKTRENVLSDLKRYKAFSETENKDTATS